MVLHFGTGGNHANHLWVDKKKMRFSVFEPHGCKGCEWAARSVEAAQSLLGPAYTRAEAHTFCTRAGGSSNGPQRHPDDEYCASWSLLFLLLRMARPGVSQTALYVRMTKELRRKEPKLEASALLLLLIRKFTKLVQMMTPVLKTAQERFLAEEKLLRCFPRYKDRYLRQTVLPAPQTKRLTEATCVVS